ncbi:MAG: AAA family ATPase, partial [Deltaproteobacteria bacterium]
MPRKKKSDGVPIEKLRWQADPAGFSFETTKDIEPLREIVGQERGVEAFRFGMGMDKPGYNVFVTGMSGSGRMATVKRLLEELTKESKVPNDLCYINNFKNPEAPILLELKGGTGAAFKQDVHDLVENLRKLIPQL